MEANTGGQETACMEENVPIQSGTSSQGETGVGQQGISITRDHAPTESGKSSKQEANVREQAIPHTGGALPMLNPMAASFTPQSQSATIAGSTSPASDIPIMQARPSTPPSLKRFAKELKELKSSELSKRQRQAVMHDQKRQLLSHRTTAKAEIDDLQGRLHREESIEGSQDILTQLKELNGLHEWTGYKWIGLEEEMADLEAEIAIPGEGEFRGL